MTTRERDLVYAKEYIGQLFKQLEFEQQAHVLRLMREGVLTIDSNRRVAWSK